MTRIDKFHALAIGKQLNALAKITSQYNCCKFCAYNDGNCKYMGSEKVCDDGHILWWLKDYKETDF